MTGPSSERRALLHHTGGGITVGRHPERVTDDDGGGRAEQARARVRSAVAGPLVFAGDGREPRRRRVADMVTLAISVVVLVAAAHAAREPVPDQDAVVSAVDRLLGWLEPLWTAAYTAASVAWIAMLAVALAARRRLLARDVVAAAALVVGAAWALAEAVDGRTPGLADVLWRVGDPSYPTTRVALAAAVGYVAGPELARPARRTVAGVVVLGAIGSLVVAAAYVPQVVGGLALGLAAGAGVRLAFGSPAGFPAPQRVSAALGGLGLVVRDLRPAATSVGSAARYTATDEAGGDLTVTVHGRDARDAQVLARLWRQLWYRAPGPQAALTRRGLVEHEALMLLVAERSGVPVPGVVVAGMASTGDAVLVTDQPVEWVPLADLPPADVTEGLLACVWQVAGTLRGHDIGHGRLNAAAVLVGPGVGDGVGGKLETGVGGAVGTGAGAELAVVDWSAARMSAPDEVRATDLAELLVSTALVGGSAPALAAARAAVGDEAVRSAVPFVQHTALSPWARDAVRVVDFDVDALRRQAAEATGAADDEVAELRRLRWRDVLLLGLTLVAAYTLLGQLADIGIDTILDELAGADLAWLIVGLVVAQVPLFCDAVAMLAAVGRPLPLAPTTVLESAIKFINLSVPSVAGKLALTIRYLQRQGVPSAVAVTQGALDSAAGFVVQILLLLVVLPGLDLELPQGDGAGSAIIWIGVAVGAAAVVGALVVALVPGLRAKVAPTVRSALGSARELLTSPPRLVRLLLANVGSQVTYALVLGVSLRALSTSAADAVSLADLIFVNTAVTLFAGIAPVPGGIGVAEAGLTAALVAVGVPRSTALATAIVHRLLTYYLPPVWGFVSLRWLGKRGYI
jgi:uncharacterized membrane protein YbhN (UPF0104 family)